VRVDDPAPGGGTIAALDAIAATGATVIVQVELTGASAGQVLLAVPASSP